VDDSTCAGITGIVACVGSGNSDVEAPGTASCGVASTLPRDALGAEFIAFRWPRPNNDFHVVFNDLYFSVNLFLKDLDSVSAIMSGCTKVREIVRPVVLPPIG
jgi:hypothetical protein